VYLLTIGKQRLPLRNPAPLATPGALNQSWSIDFMHDALVCSRRFLTFNVVDDFNRKYRTEILDFYLFRTLMRQGKSQSVGLTNTTENALMNPRTT